MTLFQGQGRPLRQLLRYTAHRVAIVAIVVILRIHCRTTNVHVVHIGSTIKRRGPEVAVSTLPVRSTTVVVPGDRRRKQGYDDTRRYNNIDAILKEYFGGFLLPTVVGSNSECSTFW